MGLDTETTVHGHDSADNRLPRAVTTLTGSGSTTVTTGYAWGYSDEGRLPRARARTTSPRGTGPTASVVACAALQALRPTLFA